MTLLKVVLTFGMRASIDNSDEDNRMWMVRRSDMRAWVGMRTNDGLQLTDDPTTAARWRSKADALRVAGSLPFPWTLEGF
jgi:hypothetical protein